MTRRAGEAPLRRRVPQRLGAAALAAACVVAAVLALGAYRTIDARLAVAALLSLCTR